MAINPDFSDLFAALNASGARYLVVGAHAVAFHAAPRFTKDLDIWIDSSPTNARLVFRALQEFGAPLQALTLADLSQPELVFQIGIAPNRIDVMTSIDGVEFSDAWEARAMGHYSDADIPLIGRAHLIQNKRAAGRPQDIIDVSNLEQASG